MAGYERESRIRDRLLAGRAAAPAGWITAPDDDACILGEGHPGGRLVLTADGIEEDVHFRMEWQDPADLGWKVVAVSASDLAAKAASPVGYLLAVAWPERLPDAVAEEVASGLREAEAAFGVPLLGGDTDITRGPLRLTATVAGVAVPPAPVLRRTARAGDRLYVTGPLGGPAAVVARLVSGGSVDETDAAWADALARFRRPVPRFAEARAAAPMATAMMDLSDGLFPDLERLLRESGCAARLDEDAIPVHAAAAASPDASRLATTGGEDYELLVAGPPELGARFPWLVDIGCTASGIPGKIVVGGRLASGRSTT